MTDTTIAAAIHFETQMAPRDTGLEATQARVPWSRSATSRLIEAKIATTTAICEPTAARKLSSGSREIGSDGASAPGSWR